MFCHKNKWELTTLDKLVKIERGIANHKPNCDPSLFCQGNIPLVCCKEVSDSNYLKILKCNKYYNSKGLKQSKLFSENTICVVGCGNSAGDSAILNFSACLSPNLYGFNSYEGISDPKFIKYCFDYPKMKEKLMKLAKSSTAQPHLTLSKLLSIKFPCPPHDIQQKIGNILSSYDELIGNSERWIEVLQNIRTSIFKEWFVNLRFPSNNFIVYEPERERKDFLVIDNIKNSKKLEYLKKVKNQLNLQIKMENIHFFHLLEKIFLKVINIPMIRMQY
ncbi:restriction endonuclease subunit S [Mycoplasma parvum]|uniref:Type I restriction modification DNA specificity domain-containing protein n=1 Tax=Mycoplasma parvum str. Indiana TaxID=1403316 RepID=U5ND40_9MOLU|nr:restriction endonuclease subunit S [Mycoplasma parvum]AGX89255.1 hypothetical protein PRV_02610 [Mycoplasma parvum str. Indiana]